MMLLWSKPIWRIEKKAGCGEAQIKEEKKRAKEVEAYEAYVKTDDYVKEIAEEKLGLVDPNEIIFKPAK